MTPRKALMVWGGWDGHHPKAAVDHFAPHLEAAGFEVQISGTLDAYLDSENLSTLSLIVPCWTMGEISNDQENGLLTAVRAGVGLGGWHGGMCDAFRKNTNYQWMTGGQWVAHPGNIIKYTVDIADPGHEITRDLGSFEIESEQYYMHTDPGNHVLASTTFSGEHEGADWIAGTVMPVAWTRRWGQGRVFHCSLGHQPTDFQIPEAHTLILRGLLWAAKAAE